MKSARHTAILQIIEKNDVHRQEELLEHLGNLGFRVTQATVSRDIKALGLTKASSKNGGYHYVYNGSAAAGAGDSISRNNRFETIFRESVVDVDHAGHIVLVKCFSGMANAACELFDSLKWENVVGTLSGDDTFFILVRTEQDATAVCSRLSGYINQKG